MDKKVNLHDITDPTVLASNKFKRCKYIMILDSTCRKSIKQLSLLLYQIINTYSLGGSNNCSGRSNNWTGGKSNMCSNGMSILILCNKSDLYNSKNVNEVEKLILLELELIATTDDSGQLTKFLSNLNSLKDLNNIGITNHIMSYSIKNSNLQEIKQYIN